MEKGVHAAEPVRLARSSVVVRALPGHQSRPNFAAS